jgi:peptidyl-prolyl cis-trans isomerase SurA
VAALNLGHILVAVPEGASEAQVAQLKARAEEAAQAARSGDFEAAAQRFSDVKTTPILGLRPADRYPELFVQSVRSAAVGSVVGPVRSPAGFHVLKVIDKSSDGVPMVVAQNHARHILLRTSAQMNEREAAERLAELRNRILQGNASFERWRASIRRTAAPPRAAIWAGPARAAMCPSSSRCWSVCSPAKSAPRGLALWRAPDPAGGTPPGRAEPA